MDDKGYEDFQAVLMAQFARLAERAGKYTGAMRKEDRDAVLEYALGAAVVKCQSFNPKKQTLLAYWDCCVQSAINSRPSWQLWRFDHWGLVPSSKVIKEASFK